MISFTQFLLSVYVIAAPQASPDANQALSRLAPFAQEIFWRVAEDEFCGCDSALTLRACLQTRPNCQIAGDLQQIMLKALDKGMSQGGLSMLMSQNVLGPFCSPTAPLLKDLTADKQAPHQGSANAPIQLVEFADFRCSHCRHMAKIVDEVIQKNGNMVHLTFIPLALLDNDISYAAAHAAMAAHAQNKFWAMHKALFAREESDFTPDVLLQLAKDIGLNIERFNADTKAKRFAATLAKFKKIGQDIHLTGTPSFYVNNRPFMPVMDIFTWQDRFAMEQHRKQAQACQ